MGFKFQCVKQKKCPPEVVSPFTPLVDKIDYSLDGFQYTVINYPANAWSTADYEIIPANVFRSRLLAIWSVAVAPTMCFLDFERDLLAPGYYLQARVNTPYFNGISTNNVTWLDYTIDGSLVTRRIGHIALPGAYPAGRVRLYEWLNSTPLVKVK